MSESTNYIPGMCNINPAEIRKRRVTGYIGLMIAAFGLSTFVALQADWPYFLSLFVPFFISALGFLQAKHKFCAAYGSSGKQHADEDTATTVIDDSDAVKADKIRSRTIYLQSFLIAAPLTAACCFLPLFY